MTRKYRQQFVDVKGILVHNTAFNGLVASGTGAPTAAATGYATGCLWIRSDGAAGSCLYVNTGSATSATWLNIA